MLDRTLKSIGVLADNIDRLTAATTDLVNLTRALHRERAVQLRQEYEEAKGLDNVRLVNFRMFFMHERLKALEINTGGEVPQFSEDEMPTLVEPNGAGKAY
jgi:hypothetical protein